jgi:hypothetical protein
MAKIIVEALKADVFTPIHHKIARIFSEKIAGLKED